MPDFLNTRRKRLWFRCHHMGTAENDVLFGRFAERGLETLDEAQLGRLEILLEENDTDLFAWATEACPVPEAFDTDIMKLIQNTSRVF